MTWSYNEGYLVTTTENGRMNSVRMLIRDTNEDDQRVQDEEIVFALSQVADDIYGAAAMMCRSLAADYAAKPDTEIDGISVSYRQISSNYSDLARRYEKMSSKFGGGNIGLPKAGGTKVSDMDSATEDTDRVKPAFRSGQFRNPRRYDNNNDWSWN